MPTRGSHWIPIALSLCVAAAPALGGNAKKHAADKATPIASCIGAGPPLPVRASDQRALLEADDRERVHEAILTRHPVLRSHQLTPQHIMLWRKGRDEWLYVNLADQPSSTPSGLCFTATIVAADFEFTAALVQKYFYPGAAPA